MCEIKKNDISGCAASSLSSFFESLMWLKMGNARSIDEPILIEYLPSNLSIFVFTDLLPSYYSCTAY